MCGCLRCCTSAARPPTVPVELPPQEKPAPASPRAVVEIFKHAKEEQQEHGGTAGAELLHSRLPAEHWGLSREQLGQLTEKLKQLVATGGLSNPSPQECRRQKLPYYDEAKFLDPTVGPNMHQVNANYIRPLTMQEDPHHGLPGLSYALHRNAYGLLCDLFISHAWSEGVFELGITLMENWPDACTGAYICSYANPQNLPELMSHLIEKPSESPFYRVLTCRPRRMLMIANSNVPIHSRLWCVYEAHCGRIMGIPMSVVGDPKHFATNPNATRAARRAIESAVKASRREIAIANAADEAATDMDIIAAGIYDERFKRWRKRAQRTTARAVERMKRALDVRKAHCSRPEDGVAIRKEIDAHADGINTMICDLIIQDQMQRAPSEPVKLTWYPGQDTVEGLRAMFCGF